MNKFAKMNAREAYEYLEALQKEIRSAPTDKIIEMQADLRELKEHIEGNQRTWAINAGKEEEFRADEQRRQEGRSYTPGRGFNRIDGADFTNRKNGGDEDTTPTDVYGTPEYRRAFFKKLLGKELDEPEKRAYDTAMNQMALEKRLDAFTTTTSGAAVIPTATLNEVISKARTLGGLLPNCRGFNIPSNISVPVGTPSNKADWHVEGAPVTTETPATISVSFGGFEIIKIFSLSAASKRMSISAFEAYITDELVACVMGRIEDSIINGQGTTQGTGLETITWVKNTNAIEYAKGATPYYEDFTATMAKLKRGYAAGAVWAMNNATLYTHVFGVVDANGRPIFINDPKTEGIGFLLGRPVVIDDNIADRDIYLGNFRYLGYNLPEGIIIEVSRESSFKSGLVDYRALAIADTKPIVAEAFVKLHEAAV